MTNTVGSGEKTAGSAADPFVTQTAWLISTVGGKDKLASRSGGLVSVRTLDNWTAGNYPRTKVTGAVRELDAWARRELPGYPTAARVPGLLESCGRYRGPVPVAAPADGAEPVAQPVMQPSRPRRPMMLWGLATAALVALAVVITAVVVGNEDGIAGGSGPTSASGDSAAGMVDVPLPSTGDGTLHTEQSGSLGAHTFGDPRTLTAGGEDIPPHTDIQVRCRYYAPSVPSVTPDGFWYLIESDQWNGLWTPANSFMNGDVPGGPYTHNTDFAVPICR